MKRPAMACQCGSGPRNRSRRQLLVLEWLQWMAPPQPPTPKEFQDLCSSLKQCQSQTPRSTYLNEQIKFQVSNRLKPAPSSAAGASQPCFFDHMCTMGWHMWAQVCPAVHHSLQYFCKASLYHIYNLQSIKKAPLGKLNTGEIIIIRNISTQLKRSHYYSWHYTRVEFITIWANNGLAELGKIHSSLHFYQVLIYTWGKENRHSGITSWYKRQTTM